MVSPQVFLVGHCGPDTSYLRMAIKKALPEAPIHAAHDEFSLEKFISAIPGDQPQPVLLVNRVLEPGFKTESGVELIADLHRKYPESRLLLVSNYEDAQAEAVKNGARPGFGKKDIGTSRLTALLQETAK